MLKFRLLVRFMVNNNSISRHWRHRNSNLCDSSFRSHRRKGKRRFSYANEKCKSPICISPVLPESPSGSTNSHYWTKIKGLSILRILWPVQNTHRWRTSVPIVYLKCTILTRQLKISKWEFPKRSFVRKHYLKKKKQRIDSFN